MCAIAKVDEFIDELPDGTTRYWATTGFDCREDSSNA